MEKSKKTLIYEIYKEGKEIVKKMNELGIDDIPIICKEPNNQSLKGDDVIEVSRYE